MNRPETKRCPPDAAGFTSPNASDAYASDAVSEAYGAVL